MYLIDTMVLSEMRKRRRHPGVVRWLRGRTGDALFLSAVTVGEIERGIERQRLKAELALIDWAAPESRPGPVVWI